MRRPGLQRGRDALGDVLAHRAVRVEQVRERGVQRHLAAVEQLDRDRRRLLLEQARPRGPAGELLLGEDALLGLAQQVRAVAARRRQVVAGEVQPVGGEQLVGLRVVQRRPLEVEEQQLGLDRGALLLDALQQRAVGRRLRVGAEGEVGVRAGAGGDLLDLRQLAHGGDQACAVDLGELAGVGVGEGVGAGLRVGEQRVDAGLRVSVPGSVQQIGEVPGDLLQLGIAHGFGGAHAPKATTAAGPKRWWRAGRR